MVVALYAGSFDPITNGHVDILEKTSKMFDKVIIAVAGNVNKKSFIPIDERLSLIKESVAHIKNVEVDSYVGLTVDYAKEKGATVLIRGLRNAFDFEYEKEMAYNNFSLNKNIETVFIIANPEYSHISSSSVREISFYKGDISNLVPIQVKKYLENK